MKTRDAHIWLMQTRCLKGKTRLVPVIQRIIICLSFSKNNPFSFKDDTKYIKLSQPVKSRSLIFPSGDAKLKQKQEDKEDYFKFIKHILNVSKTISTLPSCSLSQYLSESEIRSGKPFVLLFEGLSWCAYLQLVGCGAVGCEWRFSFTADWYSLRLSHTALAWPYNSASDCLK